MKNTLTAISIKSSQCDRLCVCWLEPCQPQPGEEIAVTSSDRSTTGPLGTPPAPDTQVIGSAVLTHAIFLPVPFIIYILIGLSWWLLIFIKVKAANIWRSREGEKKSVHMEGDTDRDTSSLTERTSQTGLGWEVNNVNKGPYHEQYCAYWWNVTEKDMCYNCCFWWRCRWDKLSIKTLQFEKATPARINK